MEIGNNKCVQYNRSSGFNVHSSMKIDFYILKYL